MKFTGRPDLETVVNQALDHLDPDIDDQEHSPTILHPDQFSFSGIR